MEGWKNWRCGLLNSTRVKIEILSICNVECKYWLAARRSCIPHPITEFPLTIPLFTSALVTVHGVIEWASMEWSTDGLVHSHWRQRVPLWSSSRAGVCRVGVWRSPTIITLDMQNEKCCSRGRHVYAVVRDITAGGSTGGLKFLNEACQCRDKIRSDENALKSGDEKCVGYGRYFMSQSGAVSTIGRLGLEKFPRHTGKFCWY